MTRRLACLCLAAALAAPCAAQLPPDKALASLTPANGLQVELFAAEPMVLNPTSMDVDHLGRVWITEAVNYRRVNFKRPVLRPEGDRIAILTDKDGDGKADESTVFYQGADIVAPLGIAVAPQADGKALKVFVCQSPDILLFEDADGDGKADGPPKKFLTGFKGFDHDHGVHGINIGPDGKLYFTVGDAGVDGLQSSDGKGPKWKSNATDCRAGTVWRCDMDGKNLELIAHNFRNNYECCVNSFGEVWLSDNDDDGNQQTRICFVMPGGNYGYHPRGTGQSHWHEEQPGIVHKAMRTGFGSPTGICFYEGTLLPEKYRGQLLHTDAGPRELRCFHIKPKGAGYELEKENLLTSTDSWFRPSDVCVAPDGSVFVADWYDPGVGGHGMGDWTRGRVYRVTPKGYARYKVPAVKLDTKEGVLEALGSPNQATRAAAIDSLRKMTAEKENEVVNRIKHVEDGKKDPPELLARIAWVLADTYEKKFDDGKPYNALTYIATIDMLSSYSPTAAQALYLRALPGLAKRGHVPAILDDPTITGVIKSICETTRDRPSVDREALLVLAGLAPEQVQGPFYALAKRYDGQDRFYLSALNIACGTDPARRDAILADFDKHFPEWNDKVVDLVWELRPKSVMPRLEKLLVDAELTPTQRARIVDILAANDEPTTGAAMLKLLSSDAPAEVKARAIDNLRLFLPGKWRPLTQGDELKAAIAKLLGDPNGVPTGLQLAAAANYAPAVADVEAIAADGKRPNEVRLEAVRTLGQIKDAKAVDALIRVGTPRNPLSVEAVKALGRHLPNGRTLNPTSERALEALQMAVALDKSNPELKSAALQALAGSVYGTNWLLNLKEKNELPADLVAEAGTLLRNSPFQGERNKALLLFPPAGKLDPKKLPSPAVLAQRAGNPEAGKAVMAKTAANEVQCLKCHMVRGAGGQIGPDLSMIGKKGSKENLFESILVPSKAIADQYLSWTIDTADGQAITGLVVGETESTVTVRDANGKDYAIPVKDIDKRTKSPLSLMPDNLAAGLTEEELVDMVAYLATLQTPSLTPDVWQAVGPFPADDMAAGLAKEYGPEKATFDPKQKFPANGGGTELEWRPIRPAAGGYVDLMALHGSAANKSVTYLVAAVESPTDQEATILLGTDDGAKLWVNGQEVFRTETTRAAAPDQDHVTVKLKKGSNRLLLKMANGDGPHGAYLTLLSRDELKLAK